MKKLATALVVILCLAGPQAVLADQHKTAGGPPKGEISQAVEMQATVTAIDLKSRMVTLKGPEGNERTIHVDKRARNLPQVKVGDVVKIAYVQHVAWQVKKPGEGASGDVSAEAAEVRAKPGEKPAGAVGQRVTFTATIEAIDLAKGTVTLKGPQGNSQTIKARNPANLKKVKVGDVVDITYTEAVAIEVEAAPK
jgi:ribosomal 50S subunit-recycling heat shock protein